MRIGLVGCTKTKLDRPAPARDLYSPSTMFAGRRAYVERSCDKWFILSAKHGLVAPDEMLAPYDETLVGKATVVKRSWSAQVLRELKEALGDFEDKIFEVHAGNDYRGFGLVHGLRANGAEVEVPAEGLGQGEQLAFYSSGEAAPARQEVENRVSKYSALLRKLEGSNDVSLSFSFSELESILGFDLPPSARKYVQWWANDATHSQAHAWLEAGWQVDQVNLTSERVSFRRS